MTNLFLHHGARLSDCGLYRHRLWRTWDDARPPLVYVMLNPSVADEHYDDPTITRCIRRARDLGAGGIIVMNLFAWIASYRDELRKVPYPVGADTDAELLEVCRGAMHVICGRGNHGKLHGRDRQVLALLHA